ncbi:abortive infection family protein [Chryseobacterium sp. A301]
MYDILKNYDSKVKISNKITEQIGKLIAGDMGSAPYLTGPKLVDFYNECGFDDVYGEGFPSRWRYSTDKIVESNGTQRLKNILEDFVDPRRYGDDEQIIDKIVNEFNQLIKYDGFALIKRGEIYKVADIQGNFINPESISTIGHEFVNEQIEKCQQKIASDDFNGAITNARTLCEAILTHIIEKIDNGHIKNDGNLINLWSKAKKVLKLDLKKGEIPDFVFQILSGLDTTINGLAGLSNNAGDRHANKFNTKRHHAKLAVNSTMTLCDFLIDVLNERKKNFC